MELQIRQMKTQQFKRYPKSDFLATGQTIRIYVKDNDSVWLYPGNPPGDRCWTIAASVSRPDLMFCLQYMEFLRIKDITDTLE